MLQIGVVVQDGLAYALGMSTNANIKSLESAITNLDSNQLDSALDALAVSWPLPTNSKHIKCPGCGARTHRTTIEKLGGCRRCR